MNALAYNTRVLPGKRNHRGAAHGGFRHFFRPLRVSFRLESL